jgi:hypothetical protein
MQADDLSAMHIEMTTRKLAFILHQRSFRITNRLSVVRRQVI